MQVSRSTNNALTYNVPEPSPDTLSAELAPRCSMQLSAVSAWATTWCEGSLLKKIGNLSVRDYNELNAQTLKMQWNQLRMHLSPQPKLQALLRKMVKWADLLHPKGPRTFRWGVYVLQKKQRHALFLKEIVNSNHVQISKAPVLSESLDGELLKRQSARHKPKIHQKYHSKSIQIQ